MPHSKGLNRSIWLVGLLAVLLIVAIPQIAGANPNPAGNNGTIKVDREPFDNAPGNEPHVGCTFQVDFYGFDEGDLNAKVIFEAHSPTGDRQVLLTDNVFIGEDDNSGGGSEAGLDTSETYTLDLSGITPHPNQGVHVKLTIHAEGSRGADTKYKVFWVTGCEAASTTTTTVRQTTTTAVGETTTSGAGGEQATNSSGQSELPFTGANSLPVVAAGLLLLVVGAGALLASRRMRTR